LQKLPNKTTHLRCDYKIKIKEEQKMSNRPKIVKITVEFEGGDPPPIEIIIKDPAVDLPEAICFGDVGVLQILPHFYICKLVEMTKVEVKANWGTNIANAIFGPTTPDNEKRRIDQFFIEKAWTTPDDKGKLLPMIRKIPGCPLG
jgi:hypothetical protein